MTTTKVIASTEDQDDRRFMTGRGAVVSAAISSTFMLIFTSMIGLGQMVPVMAVLSFCITFSFALITNSRYAKSRGDFLQTVSEAVEKETGYVMTRKEIMRFLFSGKADDGKGASLSIRHTQGDMTILLDRAPAQQMPAASSN